MDVNVFDTKEYKALQKCMAKKCPEFKDVTNAEAALIKDIRAMMRPKGPPPDPLRLVKAMQDLYALEHRRDEMLSTMRRCTEEYADMQMKVSDSSIKLVTGVTALARRKKT